MTDLNLKPNFKYITLFSFQVRDIFGIYRLTRVRSVHKGHKHVQVWNPTISKKK